MTLLHNLPRQLTSFIGREREIAEVKLLIETAPLVTLTGPGGCGKTRLALQVASELAEEGAFESGIYFVALASISDPDLVMPTIARALGVKESADYSVTDGIVERLASDQSSRVPSGCLLLLDNFEQLLGPKPNSLNAAPLLSELLVALPNLQMLVTSRTVLQLYGEQEFPVPLMEVARIEHRASSKAGPLATGKSQLATLERYEAVALFIQRARGARPDFALTEENAHAVAEICRLVDGLPLAIELAAARVKVLTPQLLLERLSRSSLQLLSGGASDLPARQQTIRGAIEWSYDLLDGVEKELFRCIALFVSGCSLQVAEALLDSRISRMKQPFNADSKTLLDLLTSLVDKSLLRQQVTDGGEPRFSMLQTVREYGLERLAESGEEEELRAEFAGYYLSLAESAGEQLKGPQQASWLDRLEEEQDNLRATLRWLLDRGEYDGALKMAEALWWFWMQRAYLYEARRWLEEVLAAGPAQATPARGSALRALANVIYEQGEYDRSIALSEEALTLYKQLDDKVNIGRSLHGIGRALREQGNYEHARGYFEESLGIWQETGNKAAVGASFHSQGKLAQSQGDYKIAGPFFEKSLALFKELGDEWGTGHSLHSLGNVAEAEGNLEQAAAYYAEAMALFRKLGVNVGIAKCIEGFAGLAGTVGQPERAAPLFSFAESLRRKIGSFHERVDRAEHERNLSFAQAQVDGERWAAAWGQGGQMSLEEALSLASEPIPFDQRPAVKHVPLPKGMELARSALPAGLTRREVEVLKLVATGMTDAQVAQRLFLSTQTVHAHLRSVYSKLGVANRLEAARFAIEHQLA